MDIGTSIEQRRPRILTRQGFCQALEEMSTIGIPSRAFGTMYATPATPTTNGPGIYWHVLQATSATSYLRSQ